MTNAPVQVNFRMPAELKDKLEAAAKEAGRSTTAEIVTRLEESLAAPSPESIVKALARLEFLLAKTEAELQTLVDVAGTLAIPAEILLPVFESISDKGENDKLGLSTLKRSIKAAKDAASLHKLSSEDSRDLLERLFESAKKFQEMHPGTSIEEAIKRSR